MCARVCERYGLPELGNDAHRTRLALLAPVDELEARFVDRIRRRPLGHRLKVRADRHCGLNLALLRSHTHTRNKHKNRKICQDFEKYQSLNLIERWATKHLSKAALCAWSLCAAKASFSLLFSHLFSSRHLSSLTLAMVANRIVSIYACVDLCLIQIALRLWSFPNMKQTWWRLIATASRIHTCSSRSPSGKRRNHSSRKCGRKPPIRFGIRYVV